MPLYESVFIARQDVSSSHVEKLSEDFQKVITDNGGTIARTEHWGLRTFAYRINKNRKGHYVLFNMDAPYEAVAEMERQMRLHEDILRSLTLRVEALETEDSFLAKPKEHASESFKEKPANDEPAKSEEPATKEPAPKEEAQG